MLNIFPIPIFNDNYIWVLQYGRYIVVIDPGEATPVIDLIHKEQLHLAAILITHHHDDHIGGVNALINLYAPPVYVSAYGKYHFPHIPVKENQQIEIKHIQQQFSIMWLPGHTLDHIAYVNAQHLFCGDTLFGAGCGRLFEGSPEQMLTSLHKIKQLDPNILVYCTHEYTSKNIAFALTLDPENQHLIERKKDVDHLRMKNIPSLPTKIGLELLTNPFLRCNDATIIHKSNAAQSDELSVFTTIRQLRNTY